MVERQFSTKLKSVQTDWGGEFRKLSDFFSSIGVIHRLSCPHTSEQNGIVERRHRHVVETGLTLMTQSHVPQRFWHFAFETAVYLINRMPSRTTTSISPFENLFKHKPDFSFLRVFGCQCYPHLRPYNPNKMDPRSLSCIFLGYSTLHHGYRCFDPQTERIYIARHVRFNEHSFPFSSPSPNPSPTTLSSPYISSYPTSPPTSTPTPSIPNTIPTYTYSRRHNAPNPLPQTSAFDRFTTSPNPENQPQNSPTSPHTRTDSPTTPHQVPTALKPAPTALKTVPTALKSDTTAPKTAPLVLPDLPKS